ncbi:nucleotide pyrophosphohydrolase [Desulfoluna spongiiphila]|uniref:nucleotide pyrophosphohydrolase n=1 Tax=Desulfoluna spongiiphila TaxID=419481 RepID=UPI00125884E9|nr:nucleotide pyrophosphohydrolase [Desulfoluna spongiiphila]VVS95727.1 dctp pyrophosphatase 1 [Desulfoluna spongiiphila]
MNTEKIQAKLRRFAQERDWEQFHSPKNISMALMVEAAELLEHFQWLTQEASSELDTEKLSAVADEIADVQIYLCRLADLLNIDIKDAVERKMKSNEAKYPADKVRGKAKKYTEYR